MDSIILDEHIEAADMSEKRRRLCQVVVSLTDETDNFSAGTRATSNSLQFVFAKYS